MQTTNNNTRRKRRRKPTLTPRFGDNSVAFEIGLIRMSLEVQKEVQKEEFGKQFNPKS